MNYKQRFLAAADVKTVPVEVPECGTFYVRTLTGTDRASLMAKYKQLERTDRLGDLPTWIVVTCLSDPGGERVFKDTDFDAVAAKSADVIDLVSKVAAELNGLDGADQGNG